MKLVSNLISLEIVKKEDTDLYEYSIILLRNYIFFSLLVILFNLFTRNFITTSLFLLIFFSLRKFSGGFHLESKTICLLFSVFLTLFIPYLAKLLYLTDFWLLGTQLVISIIIGMFPIIETPQKYISSIEKKTYKRKVLLVLFFIFLLNIVFTLFKMLEYSMIVLLTLLLSLLSVVFGFLKYKRGHIKES